MKKEILGLISIGAVIGAGIATSLYVRGYKFQYATPLVSFGDKEGKILDEIKTIKESLNSLHQKIDTQREFVTENEMTKVLSYQEEKKEEMEWCNEPADIYQPTAVIFNEINWAGDEESPRNEWIELKNITNKEIDISKWQIISTNIKFSFPEGTKIFPGQILLISRNQKLNGDYALSGILRNQNDYLYLFDKECNLYDFVEAKPHWPAGNSHTKQTMERDENLGWHTSETPGGTPKKENGKGVMDEKVVKGEKETKDRRPFDVVFELPKEIFIGEEFDIVVTLNNESRKPYDIKIGFLKDKRTVSEIYDKNQKKWISSIFYLREGINKNSSAEEFSIRINDDQEAGVFQFLIKIRNPEDKSVVYEVMEDVRVEKKNLPTIQKQEEPFSAQKECININKAPAEDLEKLTGIGKIIAQEIINNRPYSSLDDLLRVKGIGETKLQKIKEQGLACVE